MKPEKCIYLNNVPYAVKDVVRGTSNDMIARFGSPEQGETNLSLLKSVTQDSFRGGMFQKIFEETEMVSSITGAYFNDLDKKLYFSQAPYLTNWGDGMDTNGINSWAYFKGKFYISFRTQPPSAYNVIAEVTLGSKTVSPTLTPLVIPAALQGSGAPINLCSAGSYLLASAYKWMGSTPVQCHRYTGTAWSAGLGQAWQDLIRFNDRIYGIGADNVFGLIADINAGTWTHSGISNPIGDSYPETGVATYQWMAEYNGALYIAHTFGLWRYDGVICKPVLDFRNSAHTDNFRYHAVFNGRMYFTLKNRIYEFDGMSLKPLQDFSEGYKIRGLAGGTDRLWVTTINNSGLPYVDMYDNTITQYTHSVFCYNGVGWFEYHQFPSDLVGDYIGLTPIPLNNQLHVFIPDIYLNFSFEPRSQGIKYNLFELVDDYTMNGSAAERSFVVYGSDINNKYPNVPKTLSGVRLEYDGFGYPGMELLLEAQTVFEGVTSSWIPVWHSNQVGATGAGNEYFLYDQSHLGDPDLDSVPLRYHILHYRLTATRKASWSGLDPIPRIRNLSFRYTLHPRPRKQWTLVLDINGVDHTAVASGRLDGKKSTYQNNFLRKNIYDAYEKAMPILFYDIESTKVLEVDPAFRVAGTDMFSDGNTLAISDADNDEWINRRISSVVYDDANDATSMVLDPFGYRRGIGGSVTDPIVVPETGDLQVRRSFAVMVKNVDAERIIFDKNTLNAKAGYTDLFGSMTIKIEEI